jgi:hypothetical protein
VRVEGGREAYGRVDEVHGALGIDQIVPADVKWVAGLGGDLHDPADAIEHSPGDRHAADVHTGPRHAGGDENAIDRFAAAGRRSRRPGCSHRDGQRDSRAQQRPCRS